MNHLGISRATRVAFRFSRVLACCFLAGHLTAGAQQAERSSAKVGTTVSAGFFGQFTSSAVVPNGNSEGASVSGGTLLGFQRSYRSYLGYDVNYGYTRYSDLYSFYKTPPPAGITVSTGMHELSAAYRIQGPTLPFHLDSFADAGTGMLIFSPSTGLVYNPPVQGAGVTPVPVAVKTQIRMPVLFGGGFSLPLPNRFGAQFEYRGLLYRAPSFGQGSGFETGRNMITSEPAVSFFYKF